MKVEIKNRPHENFKPVSLANAGDVFEFNGELHVILSIGQACGNPKTISFQSMNIDNYNLVKHVDLDFNTNLKIVSKVKKMIFVLEN